MAGPNAACRSRQEQLPAQLHAESAVNPPVDYRRTVMELRQEGWAVGNLLLTPSRHGWRPHIGQPMPPRCVLERRTKSWVGGSYGQISVQGVPRPLGGAGGDGGGDTGRSELGRTVILSKNLGFFF